jgi:hypothetical protein
MFKQRMYFFVPYNISPIQQAIQAGHAALEYAYRYHNEKDYRNFIERDKTWIILNGGTTQDGRLGYDLGTMQELHHSIMDAGVHHSIFCEPDLNSALTAVCFLADERVWDRETYPDFYDWAIELEIDPELKYAIDLKKPQVRRFILEEHKAVFPELYEKWTNEVLGNHHNEFLRNLISGKKLA